MPPAALLALIAVCASVLLLSWRRLARRWQHRSNPNLPALVTNTWNLLLGCSLDFRKDPVAFLQSVRRQHGGVFTLDMAGQYMVIMADPIAVQQYVREREDTLDSTECREPFGFGETLGQLSNQHGAGVMSLLLRRLTASDLKGEWMVQLLQEMQAVHSELCVTPRIDLLPYSRQLVLRSMMRFFFGREYVAHLPERFFSQFASFQDAQEDAVGVALAVPKWIIAPVVLSPVNSSRVRLQKMLLDAFKQTTVVGPYLKALKEHCTVMAVDLHCDESQLFAELIISFLFAAHKNPSISGTHLVTMLLSNPDCLQRVRDEAHAALRQAGSNTGGDPAAFSASVITASTPYLDSCISESLRLTVHTIGSLRLVKKAFSFTTSTGQSFTLPPGYLVGTSQCALSYREEVYPKASTFDPARFAEQQLDLQEAGFLPFSDGKHRCPGRAIALAVIKAFVLLWVLSHPSLALAPDHKVTIAFDKATLAQTSATLITGRQ